jgi:hypothetical protein
VQRSFRTLLPAYLGYLAAINVEVAKEVVRKGRLFHGEYEINTQEEYSRAKAQRRKEVG